MRLFVLTGRLQVGEWLCDRRRARRLAGRSAGDMQRSVVNVNVNVGSDRRRVCRSVEAECRLAEKSRGSVVGDKTLVVLGKNAQAGTEQRSEWWVEPAAVATGGEQAKKSDIDSEKASLRGFSPVYIQSRM